MPLIGIDIVEKSNIERLLIRSYDTLKDIFSEFEMEYCFSKKDPSKWFGIFFAIKEAFVKALQSKILSFELDRLEVIKKHNEELQLRVLDVLIEKRIMEKIGKEEYKINISASATRDICIAQVEII